MSGVAGVAAGLDSVTAGGVTWLTVAVAAVLNVDVTVEAA
jgi:hypothetical protein